MAYPSKFLSLSLFLLIFLSVNTQLRADGPALIHEEEINNRPCNHCPNYLNLTKEINKIVEKVKSSDSITESNEQLIQLNKLKFLYYVVRSESDTGKITCTTMAERDIPITPKLDGQFKTVVESVMNIKAVTDVQFIPKGNQEVYYYYRGADPHRNIIIEVKMNKDGTSRMRYFSYQTKEEIINKSLPDLYSDNNKKEPLIKVGVDLKNKDDTKSKAINYITVGTQVDLIDNLSLSANNQLNNDQQTASVSLNRGTNRVASLSGTNNSLSGKKSVSAVLPMEISLNTESELKIKGSFQDEYSTDGSGANSIVKSKRMVKLGLTDKNNEYFTVKADSDSNNVQGVEVSTKYKVGKNSSLGGGYRQVTDGSKSFNISNVTKLANHKTLTTSFGEINNKKFIQTQLEKNINTTTSMTLSIKTDFDNETIVMYQFHSIF